jgi:hypothetical protein
MSTFAGCGWPIERVSVGGELVARQGAGSLGSWWKQETEDDTPHFPRAAKRRSAAIIRWLTLKDGKMGFYDNRYRLCVSLAVSDDIVGWSRTAANSHLGRSVADGDGLANTGKAAYLLSLQLRLTEDEKMPTAISMESLEAEAIATKLREMWRSQRKVRACRGPIDGDPAVPTCVSRSTPGLMLANSEQTEDGPAEEGIPPVPSNHRGLETPQSHKRMAPEFVELGPEPEPEPEPEPDPKPEPKPKAPHTLDAAVEVLTATLQEHATLQKKSLAVATSVGEDQTVPEGWTPATASCVARGGHDTRVESDSGSDSDSDSAESDGSESDEDELIGSSSRDELRTPRPGEGNTIEPEPDLDDPATSPLFERPSASLLPSILKSGPSPGPPPLRKGSRFSIGTKRHKTIKFPQDEHRLRMVYPYLLHEHERQGKREALVQMRKNRQLETTEEVLLSAANSDDGDDWSMLGRLPGETTPATSTSARLGRQSLRESLREAFARYTDSDGDTSTGSSDDDDSSISDDDDSSSSGPKDDGGNSGSSSPVVREWRGSVTRYPAPL